MRIVVQRSKKSTVKVEDNIIGSIDFGLVLLVGFHIDDTIEDLEYLANKVLNLRIFDDESGIMNKSIKDIKGSILSISQFTLYGDTTNGNRPSYQDSMKGEVAIDLYNKFNNIIRKEVIVEEGKFGAEMILNITNDGPVTIILDSKKL